VERRHQKKKPPHFCEMIRLSKNAEDMPHQLMVFSVECPSTSYFVVPPSITIKRNSVDVNQGDDVTLPCDAQGDPTPYVEWSNGGRQLQRSRTQQSFLIPNIQPSDAGTYVCRAVNRAGSVSYSLVVRVSPVSIG